MQHDHSTMHPCDTTVLGNMDAEIGLLQGFTLTGKQSLRTDSSPKGTTFIKLNNLQNLDD